jgi:hypothetical protein
MQESIIIHGDESSIQSLKQALQSQDETQVQEIQRKNLDGNTEVCAPNLGFCVSGTTNISSSIVLISATYPAD